MGTTPPSDAEDRQRFEVELEFVQCLSNPHYLNFLAQRGYFDDPAFVNYLDYLTYWKQPNYARFLKYPQCLMFLQLLQHDSFRKVDRHGHFDYLVIAHNGKCADKLMSN